MIFYAILCVFLTGCEGEVKGLKYNDGYLEVYNEAELRYISEVSQRNAVKEEPLMSVEGKAIPFNEAKLRLMKDVVIKNEWIPIKYGLNGSFKVIDGNHHSIAFKNVKIELNSTLMDSTNKNKPINYGLFNKLEQCEIKNLKLIGNISLYNKTKQDGHDVYLGGLAGELHTRIRLADIINAVNISFTDYTNHIFLELGGIAGIMDGGNDGIEFSGIIVNEGNLRAEGCEWTQIGGICASITQNVMFGQDVTMENKGEITAELTNTFFTSNNFIGGIFGEYNRSASSTASEYGSVEKMINEGKILIIDNSYEDALYAIGGICGRSEGLRSRVNNMENIGKIEIIGDHLQNHPRIDDLIGW